MNHNYKIGCVSNAIIDPQFSGFLASFHSALLFLLSFLRKKYLKVLSKNVGWVFGEFFYTIISKQISRLASPIIKCYFCFLWTIDLKLCYFNVFFSLITTGILVIEKLTQKICQKPKNLYGFQDSIWRNKVYFNGLKIGLFKERLLSLFCYWNMHFSTFR